MHYRIMRIMVILFMISVVPITLGWRAAQKNPQFGIPEFGINMSSIIKKTHSVVSQQQHNIAVIKNNFVHLCANEGLCRSFVSKNFPYPYPNQYSQVFKQKAASSGGILWLML